MKLDSRQIDAHLKSQLLPCYHISGDEPLLVQETVERIRSCAQAQGYDSRESYHIEPGFDWASLTASTDALSLFASRRLVELHFNKPTPGDVGSRALRELSQRLPEDTVFIIVMPKLEAKAKSAAWYKALDKVAAMIQVWPLERRELGQWLQARVRQGGLDAEPDAIRLLADYVEGNLLAAAQEIDKLKLSHAQSRISVQDIENAMSDNARFDVFGLVDSALQGDAVRVQRMLATLEREGVAPTLVLWALSRELRTVQRLAKSAGRSGHVDANKARSLGVWQKRLPLITTAIKRQNDAYWQDLLRLAANTDRVIKGRAAGSVWDELLQLALGIAGVLPLSAGLNAQA